MNNNKNFSKGVEKMNNILFLSSVVIIVSIFMYRYLSKFGVPMLLVFISLGMIFGVNGIFKIDYENYELSRDICSFALIYIIFFGGFGTNLSMAKGIIKKSLILSSLGVIFTSFLTGIFAHYILKLDWYTSLLIGSVLGSTDAASVFAILRSHKLNLKENTASLLEIESGSNDPFAYVLTISFLTLSKGGLNLPILLFKQVCFGLLVGYIFTKLSCLVIRKSKNLDSGMSMALIMASMLLSYSLSEFIGGNGYITVYLLGVLIGNIRFNKKSEIVSFFNGITSIMQILIFFLLGLLVNPLEALKYTIPAILIMIAMTILIRPFVVYLLISPLKSSRGQKLLVSWAGLRGAASVVFAILVVVAHKEIGMIVFNIAFIVVLLSIAIQGSLLPFFSRKFDMIDEEGDVLKTFNDYSDTEDVDFITAEINESHKWVGKQIKNLEFMPSVLLVLIIRNGQNIIPNGDTIIEKGDRIVLCGSSFVDKDTRINLYESIVDKTSKYKDKSIRELDRNTLIVMIKRDEVAMIPSGNTTILENDILNKEYPQEVTNTEEAKTEEKK